MSKVLSVCACILLILPTGLSARATAYQEESYTPSGEAQAAAARFRGAEGERKFADLEVVIKELVKEGAAAPAGGRVEYRAITSRQLLDLLGPPPQEWEKGVLAYSHNHGTTSFRFEHDRLKDVATLSEMIIWYAYPRQSLPKRLWYKAVRWTNKLKRLLS